MQDQGQILMKVLGGLFSLVSFIAIVLPHVTYALDPTGISNPNNWQQKTHTATLTVADDGTSLLYRNKDTGMSLNAAAAPNSKVKLVDESIAPQTARGAASKTPSTKSTTTSTTSTVATKEPYTAPTSTTASKTGAAKVAKGAGAAVGTALGGYMIYDATSGQGKHNAGDVVQGVLGGVTAGAAIGTAVGSPGIGTAVGAVVGGAITGSQLFSETDCLYDPVLEKFTCCHTAFNKGERYADIGDYMFCADEKGNKIYGGVRQCQQAGSATKDSWWNGLWKDDAWSNECIVSYCTNETEPMSGIGQYLTFIPDKDNFCWYWTCKEGYTRSGNTCVQTVTGKPVETLIDPYDVVINKINELRQQIISECGNI